MPKYSRQAENPTKAAQAGGTHLRTHYKKAREVGAAIKGMDLPGARRFLEDVLKRKQAVPFLRYTGGCGRHAQGKMRKTPGSKVGWPDKPVRFFLDLLKNVEANAESKGLEPENLTISHMQVNRAAKMRRRTYRAHGRINAYMCNPCHIELIVSEKNEDVARPADLPRRKATRKELAKRRVASGGGVEAEA